MVDGSELRASKKNCPQADVVAGDDHRPVDPEVVVQQPVDVARHRDLVVAARGAPRVPGAAVVGGDHPKAVAGELGDHAPPLPPRLREAVEEHDRAHPLAGVHLVQAQAGLDVGHPVPHGMSARPNRSTVAANARSVASGS
jgi:hypothetical protein